MTVIDEDPTKIDIQFDPREQRMSGIATHGMTPFNVPFISQITDDLWQGGCANGLIVPPNIKHIVSLYPWERYGANHELDSHREIKMYDSEDQGFEQVEEIAVWVNECRRSGPTLVHCQAGLNRSSLVAATALILEGMQPAAAIALLRERRSPACLCNKSFENWLLTHFEQTDTQLSIP